MTKKHFNLKYLNLKLVKSFINVIGNFLAVAS